VDEAPRENAAHPGLLRRGPDPARPLTASAAAIRAGRMPDFYQYQV